MKNADNENFSQQKNVNTHDMRKILKSKRVDIDVIIKEILARGEKTAVQLRKEVVDSQRICSTATFYKHLKKLVKNGEIKKSGYRLVKMEKEVDPKEISECIRKLKETDHKDLLRIRSEDLRRLCDGKRVAHRPNVLSFLESSLRDPKFKDPEVLFNLIGSIRRILAYERKRDTPKRGIINRINENIEQMKQIMKKQRDHPVLGEILYFLGETGEEKAVRIIFDLVVELSDKEFENTKDTIARSLFSPECTLYRKHSKLINSKIDEMITNRIPSINKRGKELAQEKQHRRAYA